MSLLHYNLNPTALLYTSGGLYAGILTVLLVVFTNDRGTEQPYKRMTWLSVVLVCAFIANLIAASVQGVEYDFLNQLETCVDDVGCYGTCSGVYFTLANGCSIANSGYVVRHSIYVIEKFPT